MILIVLFPTDSQVSMLLKDYHEEKIFVIQNTVDNNAYDVVYVKSDNDEMIAYLRENNARILCCHEEGIFWLRIRMSKLWELGFSEKYLDCIFKSRFKQTIRQNGLLTASFVSSLEETSDYPIIGKPDIGFGSIGVKLLGNKQEALEYAAGFDDMIGLSGVGRYQQRYFKGCINIPIFEQRIEGDFYRTPFLVVNGRCCGVFPVKGRRKAENELTDFHWREFEYNPEKSITCIQARDTADKLVRLFGADDGCYVMEYIITPDAELYLLEFSPRQTSSRISRMIELSLGFSLEKAAVDLFAHREIDKFDFRDGKIILLKIAQTDNYPTDTENGAALIEANEEKSVYGQNIISLYYERTL